MIYFDNAATTPLDEIAINALKEYGVEKFFNVGDSSKPGMIYQAVAAAHDCAIALE